MDECVVRWRKNKDVNRYIKKKSLNQHSEKYKWWRCARWKEAKMGALIQKQKCIIHREMQGQYDEWMQYGAPSRWFGDDDDVVLDQITELGEGDTPFCSLCQGQCMNSEHGHQQQPIDITEALSIPIQFPVTKIRKRRRRRKRTKKGVRVNMSSDSDSTPPGSPMQSADSADNQIHQISLDPPNRSRKKKKLRNHHLKKFPTTIRRERLPSVRSLLTGRKFKGKRIQLTENHKSW